MDDTESLAADGARFLSVTRSQRFDLFAHLALNLPQPLRLTGPVGIGKTYFLRALEQQISTYATTCYQAASPGLSLERLLDALRIRAEIEQQKSGHPFGTSPGDLSGWLEVHVRNKRPLLLLLDDAQAALPGFLDGLSQFSGLNPGLKLVVALNGQALAERNITDAEFMNEAFEVEIPPLNLDETARYIGHITAAHPAFLTGQMSDAAFRQQVFKATGGVPGQIEKYLEQPPRSSPVGMARASIPALAGSGLLIALAAGLTLYLGQGLEPPANPTPSTPVPLPAEAVPPTPVPSPELPPPLATAEPEAADAVIDVPPGQQPEPAVVPLPLPLTAEPEATAPPALVEAMQPPPSAAAQPETPASRPPAPPVPAEAIQPPPSAAAQPEPPASQPPAPPPLAEAIQPPPSIAAQPEPPASQPPAPPALAEAVKPPPSTTTKPEAPASPVPNTRTIARLEGEDWIMARPPGYYTLQVATAENDAQLRKFMQERPTGEARASLSMRQRNRTLLPVFQGVYPDQTSAAAALRQWQRGGTVAFIRRFDSLQRIIGQRTGQAAPIPTPTPTSPMTPPSPAPGEAPVAESTAIPPSPQPPVPPDAQSAPADGVSITALGELSELSVRNTPPETPETSPVADDGAEPQPPSPTRGKEIYYRLVEGKPPVVEIIEPEPEPAVAPSPPAPSPAPAVAVAPSPATLLHGADWLLAQPPELYTLQVITVSSTGVRDQVVRQFPPDAVLISYPVRRGPNTLYPVFFGTYPDVAAARQAMSRIPRALDSTPILRQFKTLQREIDSTASP